MEFMDLLFREYASPFILLDTVIESGELCNFLDIFEKQHEERQLWEFYIHKLSAFDERTFDEFKRDVKGNTTSESYIATDEELETTVQESFNILNNFTFEERGCD